LTNGEQIGVRFLKQRNRRKKSNEPAELL
jgi:hypothetical protein